jgi:hypothetical protein
VLISLINAVKKNKLDIKYSLVWIFLVVALIILTCFKNLLEILSDVLGIASPVNMLFLCGFCFSLLIIYTLTVALSKLSYRVRKLAQEIALLNNKLERQTDDNTVADIEMDTDMNTDLNTDFEHSESNDKTD